MYVSIASRELRLVEIGDFTSPLSRKPRSPFASPSRSVLGFPVARTPATYVMPEGCKRTPTPHAQPPQHKSLDTPRCVANFKVGHTRGVIPTPPTVVALRWKWHPRWVRHVGKEKRNTKSQ